MSLVKFDELRQNFPHRTDVKWCLANNLNPRIVKPLRRIICFGLKCSQAAREYGYSPRYLQAVMRQIRRDGLLEEARQALRDYDLEDLDEAFWTSLRTMLQEKNEEAIKLYSEIREFIRKKGIQPMTNVQVNLNNLGIAQRFLERGRGNIEGINKPNGE